VEREAHYLSSGPLTSLHGLFFHKWDVNFGGLARDARMRTLSGLTRAHASV